MKYLNFKKNHYLRQIYTNFTFLATLLLHLSFFFLFSFTAAKYPKFKFDLLSECFSRSLYWSLFFLTQAISPISWIWFSTIESVSRSSYKDGTDLFLISTKVPVERKQLFWEKVTSLAFFSAIFYYIAITLPYLFYRWNLDYFVNLTLKNTFLILIFELLIIPFIIILLTLFLFSLGSIESFFYHILVQSTKVINIASGFIIKPFYNAIFYGGKIHKKLCDLGTKIWEFKVLALILSTLSLFFFLLLLLQKAFREFEDKKDFK